ncbi:hypothetical protein CA13_35560 [Planctomycetes bacterium CA13]|uniref:TIGR02453 family protein n=1 Tax=Novipirellula herctigrandis TaxID=2527986 RepID=A0A5C5Z4W1_9BACT|nr:hypothetical protein CA13_35560 [Planctomycetes bacterium CA13]
MPPPVIPQNLFHFLDQLMRNRNRNWFAEHKYEHERLVRAPAVELVRQIEKPLARIAPMLAAVPKGHGRSVMRVYRGTRCSDDKTRGETNVGISLRHQANRDIHGPNRGIHGPNRGIHGPGACIHLATDECFVANGCWRPERSVLAAIRSKIDSDPAKIGKGPAEIGCSCSISSWRGRVSRRGRGAVMAKRIQ